MTTKRLPDLTSDLLRVAVNDLIKCEIDPRYEIDMDDWHRPNSHCSVCFAGAVMAKTKKVDPSIIFSPHAFGLADSRKLTALDSARRGNIRKAVLRVEDRESEFNRYTFDRSYGGGADCTSPLFDESFELPNDIDVEIYEEHPDVFKLQMLAIADELEMCGS